MPLRNWIFRKTVRLNSTSIRSQRKKQLARLQLERLEDRFVPSIDFSSVGIWQERGPGPISVDSITGNVDVGGSQIRNPQVGAVEALAPHLTNKNILYVATTNGGIWKTTDAYDRDPVWTPLTDQFPSLSFSSLAFSPMDGAHQTLFAGIGVTSNDAQIGGPLDIPHIFRTTDGGSTWSLLGGSIFNGLTLASVVPTQLGTDAAHQVILVAAHDPGNKPNDKTGQAGLYRSVDGGITFQKITSFSGISKEGTAFSMLPSAAVTQIVADPGNVNTFYAGVGQTDVPGNSKQGLGVFKSIDGGLTWFQVNHLITGVSDETRIRLTAFNKITGNTVQNTIYAAIIGGDNRLSGVFRTDDHGQNWRVMGTSGFGDNSPPDIYDGVAQGGINLSLTVNPNDVNDVYIGGSISSDIHAEISSVSRWTLNPTTKRFFWNVVSGLFDRPHPDSRDMSFDAAGQLLESDDGGVYRHVDHDHWDAVTGSLENTEIYIQSHTMR